MKLMSFIEDARANGDGKFCFQFGRNNISLAKEVKRKYDEKHTQ